MCMEPNNGDYYQFLWASLLREGKLTDAESDLWKSIQLDPKVGKAYRDLGAVLQGQ